MERDRLLSLPYMSRRTKYDFDALLLNHNVKLITGPRRVGKSTQALLMLKGKNFAYLNFDDNALLDNWDEELAMQILDEVYPGYDFLLLDEVQNINNWDIWVAKLYRRGINMVITGSNANMLSGEMATMLTGRYLEIKMFPFSLEEVLEWNHVDMNAGNALDSPHVEAIASEFLRYGGFPESVVQRAITGSYLSALFDSILFKDVVKRHRLRNVTDLGDVATFLLSNCGNRLSYNDVARDLKLASINTAKKYMEYLREPFLLYYLSRYDNKLRLMKRAPRKVYAVDNGIIRAKAFGVSENLGHLLENQVFIELLRRGYEVDTSIFYYHSRNNKEVDFVLREGPHVKQLIQVCYDLGSPKTEKREVSALIEAAQELKCDDLVIVTNKEERIIERNGHTVKVVPVMKF